MLAFPEPGRGEAEASLMQSLELSRDKGAKAWELRATIDLARILAERGRRNDARLLLQAALEGFVDASDMADIRVANERLQAL